MVVLWVEPVPAVVLAKEVVSTEEPKNIRKIVSEVSEGAYAPAAFEVAALETLPFVEQDTEGAARVDGEEGVETEKGVVAYQEVGVNLGTCSSHAREGLRLNMVSRL